MCIKSKKLVLVICLLICVIKVIFNFSTTNIKIKTPVNKINYFIFDTIEIEAKDFKKLISKIEKLRFYRTTGNASTRENDLHIVIKDFEGNEEIVRCNDNLLLHIYNKNVIENYKIPLITEFYIIHFVKP